MSYSLTPVFPPRDSPPLLHSVPAPPSLPPSPPPLTVVSFIVLLTLMDAVCRRLRTWAALSAWRPCGQLEMADESMSLSYGDCGRPGNYRRGRPRRDTRPGPSSPLTFIGDPVNVKAAHDCSRSAPSVQALRSHVKSHPRCAGAIVCITSLHLVIPFVPAGE